MLTALLATFLAAPPGVLVVVTDEHNFRTLGCYRDLMAPEQAFMWGRRAVVDTPHIDRIGREGVVCTRAYATSPVCSPCRAAMFTGLYPHQAGVPGNDMPLVDGLPTLATVLRDAGFATGYAGKWHLDGPGKPQWQPERDFGFADNRFMFNRGHWKKLERTPDGPRVAARNARGRPSYAVDGADAETFATDFLTDRALEFLDRHRDEPFLYVLSLPDPHGPNTVREPYDTMYDDLPFEPPRTFGLDGAPQPGWLSPGGNHSKRYQPRQMARYFGMVKCIDDNVGRLLARLDEQGRLDNTVVVFTSDHGDLCYEHDRLNKGNPYEGSARVPLLIRHPARFAAGAVERGAVATVDLTPTLLGLAGAAVPESMRGRDLSGRLGQPGERDPILLRNAGRKAAWLAAIDGRHKLILSVADGPWLLDAEEDPDELLNFHGRPGTAEVASRLTAALRAYAAAQADPHAQHPRIARWLK